MARLSAGERGAASPAGRARAGRPKLVFVGFMGAGKSYAARLAAGRLGTEALDADALLEAELGEPITSFFDREGEPAFRERESALVAQLLDSSPARVLALGGGAVESAAVRERLADHLCVYLEADAELAWERARRSDRPLARDREPFLELLARRRPLYESVARAVVPADEMDAAVEPALPALVKLLELGAGASVRMVWAGTDAGGYPVYLGSGAIDEAGSVWTSAGRPFVVADEHVAKLHGERLRSGLEPLRPVSGPLTVPAGERHKTLAEAERILESLARERMERQDAVVALGGGVIGDLAGFCAAVYQRGVAVVQVPTTLVAQADSAYGGKTGVDLPQAKNYVGSFHQPALVLTDPGVLETLPAEELRAGFSEVLKTALIAGGDLWQGVLALGPIERAPAEQSEALSAVIEGCVRTKLAIVADDEFDHGRRAALNLGHTLAHALEAATGYGVYRHGEAVALGLLAALRLSERQVGLDPSIGGEVEELLRRHGLPTTLPGVSTEELLARAAFDKKRAGGRPNLVLLRAPGDVVTHQEVPESALREAIDELRSDGERS